MRTLLWLLIILGSQSCVAAGAALQEPAPLETSASDPSPGSEAWKTYRNSRYGYRIEYPRSAELNSTHPERVELAFEVPLATGKDVLTFNVTVHDNPAALDAKEWGIKQWAEGSVREIAPVKISGRPAYRFKVFEYDQDSYHFYLQERKNIYELDFVDPETVGELTPDAQRRYRDMFQRILASFSFNKH